MVLATEESTVQDEHVFAQRGDAWIASFLQHAEEEPQARVRACRILGRLHTQEGSAFSFLLRRLHDRELAAQRAAVIALGKVGYAHRANEIEPVLHSMWADASLPLRRALAATLGKIGSSCSVELLQETSLDPELERLRSRALLMLQREQLRKIPARLRGDCVLPLPFEVVLFCRRGLEATVCAEVGRHAHPQVLRGGQVRVVWKHALEKLWKVRTMLSFGLRLPSQTLHPSQHTLLDAVTCALTSPEADRLLHAFTEGPIRYRLDWSQGGHRRALVWACAQKIATRCPWLCNDPTESLWEARVHETPRNVEVVLVPRGLPDPRFAYRVCDVPAASHPTLAAALARLAKATPHDVVWDPFVGSGTELIECAKQSGALQGFGTDIDPKALAAAQRNFTEAGLHNVRCTIADATAFVPPRAPTLVITNPPMGRRVPQQPGGVLLERFLRHVRQVMAPTGRLVWISPAPARTNLAAQQAGFRIEVSHSVDMGGFRGEMQRLTLAG